MKGKGYGKKKMSGGYKKPGQMKSKTVTCKKGMPKKSRGKTA